MKGAKAPLNLDVTVFRARDLKREDKSLDAYCILQLKTEVETEYGQTTDVKRQKTKVDESSIKPVSSELRSHELHRTEERAAGVGREIYVPWCLPQVKIGA